MEIIILKNKNDPNGKNLRFTVESYEFIIHNGAEMIVFDDPRIPEGQPNRKKKFLKEDFIEAYEEVNE